MNTIKHNSTVTPWTTEGQKHIVVVGGGMSAEREVSLNSSNAVLEALRTSGNRITFVDMGVDIGTVLQDLKPDVVFNCLHGTFGEDGCLPALLNIMDIPYTHSGVIASVLSFNKLLTRNCLHSSGIPLAPAIILEKGQVINSEPMSRPYVLKPLAQGSSIGVEVVLPDDDFNLTEYTFPYGDKVLIEKYLVGPEIQVAILNGKVLGTLEIELVNSKFYDYRAKYTPGFANHIYPARLPTHINAKIVEYSEKIYGLMGCRGIARAEFIYVPADDEVYFLELNTHPGMTDMSICPELAQKQGISFSQLVSELLKTASCD